MPKIRWNDLPSALRDHLFDRFKICGRWSEAGAGQILAARRLWCNRHSPADVTTVATVRHLVGAPYRRQAAA